MKKEFLRIAGVKSEKAFYEKYPNEEAFFAAHPTALKQLAKGGTPEAFPQTITFENFSKYGAPVPPTYYAHGGAHEAFPMAQPADMFFSPGYGSVYNPYNRAAGGNIEAYPQAIPYGNLGVSKAFYFMQDGGGSQQDAILQQVVQLLQQGIDPQTVVEQLIKAGLPEQEAIQTVQAVAQQLQGAMQQEQPQQMPAEQMPPQEGSPMMAEGGQPENTEIGVGNRLGLFMSKVSNTAASYQNKKAENTAKGFKKGGALMKAADGVSATAKGKYGDPNAYITANPLDAYTASQFWYDPAYKQAYQNYIDSAYRDYYELDPDATVYKNDPIYQQLQKGYGAPGSASSNSNNQGITINNLNDLSRYYTPDGRIKSKSWVNGEFGRGRSNDYMWQTMFNTDNLAEAQRLAAETGLKINEGTAGLFGKRKKYTYEWDQNQMPGTPGTPGSNPAAPGTNPGAGTADPNMGFFARMFYKPGNLTGNQRQPSRYNPDQRDPLSPAMESQFDPTGYNSQYSDARNQIFQNRRRRMGDKLDALYQKQADMKEMYGQGLSNRDMRKMDRLDTKLTRSGHRSGYSFYEPPTPTMDMGGIPEAAWGLFNKTAGNENAPQNKMVEKERSSFADDYLKGMDAFERNQNIKGAGTNLLNTDSVQQALGATNPMKRFYGNEEAVYPGRGIGRGNSAFTYNPINMDTQPYKNGPAYFDNSAAFSLAPSFQAKQGGSINRGDVRYMTDDEIAEFVANGGQVEYLD